MPEFSCSRSEAGWILDLGLTSIVGHGKNFRLQKEFWNCQDGSLMDHVSSFLFFHAFILLLF